MQDQTIYPTAPVSPAPALHMRPPWPSGRPTEAERARRRGIEAQIAAGTYALPDPPPEAPPPPRRRQANPFGALTQKMGRPPRPGYHRHWFNDDPSRIEQAKAGGYEHVLKDGAPETYPVGTTKTGGVLLAYHMEIPEEFYREDMAAQQGRVDDMENAMRRAEDEQGKPGKDGRYIPSRGIKIQTV